MCGIVGYIGNRKVVPLLIKGLKRLEYRGYDSAGIAIIQDGKVKIFKRKGKVSDLEKSIHDKDLTSTVGIGHTRWATHGEPNGGYLLAVMYFNLKQIQKFLLI